MAEEVGAAAVETIEQPQATEPAVNTAEAVDDDDVPMRGGDESAAAESSARTKESSPRPASGVAHLSGHLVELALEAGLTEEDIADYDDKGLARTIKIAMRTAGSSREEAPATGKDEKDDKPDPLWDDYAHGLTEDNTHGPVLEEFTKTNDRRNKQIRSLHERLSAIEGRENAKEQSEAEDRSRKEVRDFQKSFMKLVSDNPRLRDVFGDGDPKKMTAAQREAATEVIEATQIHRNGYAFTSRGKSVPPMGELFAQHVKIKYGHLMESVSGSGKTREQLAAERAKQIVDLPSGGGARNGAPPKAKGKEAALRWMGDWRRTHGQESRG